MLRWLKYEQTVNERIYNEAVYRPIDHRSNTVRGDLWPEHEPVWEQDVIWLPNKLIRRYGFVDDEIRAASGVVSRRDHNPLFLHPQPPGSHRQLGREYGRDHLAGIAATPTSSFRSVVAWSRAGDRQPVLLKLSLGAVIGKIRRALRENQIARAALRTVLHSTLSRPQRDYFLKHMHAIIQKVNLASLTVIPTDRNLAQP